MSPETSTHEKRRFNRFHDSFFGNVDVSLAPVPPLYGEPARGGIFDLSSGGMALLLADVLPRKISLQMTLVFPDGFVAASLVRICRISMLGASRFLHGIEFLDMAPSTIARIEGMVEDSRACNARIKEAAEKICQSDCSLYRFCRRPQCATRTAKNVSAVFDTAAHPIDVKLAA